MGVFGGVPYYLEEVAPDASLGENIQQTILSRHGSLRNEPDYVLQMELTEPTRYFSILETIAGGKTSRNEIAGTTGIDYNQLSKYLQRLLRLRLVDRHFPVTEQKERTKRSRYRIRNPFFRFGSTSSMGLVPDTTNSVTKHTRYSLNLNYLTS
nr:hypothetical protein [Halorussus salinisoli]